MCIVRGSRGKRIARRRPRNWLVCGSAVASEMAAAPKARKLALNPEYLTAEPTDDEFRGVRQMAPLAGGTSPSAEEIEEHIVEGERYICQQCDDELLATDDFCIVKQDQETGEVLRWICKPCNSARTRIHRMRKATPEAFAGWESMDPEKRKAVFKQAHTMFGSALQKHIQDELVVTSRRRTSSKFKEQGDYQLLTEVRTWPRFVKDPAALSNLERLSPKMLCPITGECYIYVPQYRFECEEEDLSEQKKSRNLSGESKIANPKCVKPEKATPDTVVKKIPAGVQNKVVGATGCARCICAHALFAHHNSATSRHREVGGSCDDKWACAHMKRHVHMYADAGEEGCGPSADHKLRDVPADVDREQLRSLRLHCQEVRAERGEGVGGAQLDMLPAAGGARARRRDEAESGSVPREVQRVDD